MCYYSDTDEIKPTLPAAAAFLTKVYFSYPGVCWETDFPSPTGSIGNFLGRAVPFIRLFFEDAEGRRKFRVYFSNDRQLNTSHGIRVRQLHDSPHFWCGEIWNGAIQAAHRLNIEADLNDTLGTVFTVKDRKVWLNALDITLVVTGTPRPLSQGGDQTLRQHLLAQLRQLPTPDNDDLETSDDSESNTNGAEPQKSDGGSEAAGKQKNKGKNLEGQSEESTRDFVEPPEIRERYIAQIKKQRRTMWSHHLMHHIAPVKK
ncbi:hypothetical protein B0H67DRAFT_551740 [Lasiosphaeris hirsuta]|uniref:Uncharacterized protein n=1 Tax=Lasiosphaeris hirsuta TaxID=260670 RepID=A0AA40AP29_9PEZI|nr:hypothetical protein B0H67DRAFT_551740 [Lasiosphaeris hirsuta]